VRPAAQFIAVMAAGLFAGAALYVSLVESRATLGLQREDPVAHFVRGFARGGALQAPLVLLGVVAGLTSAVVTGDAFWIAGAVLMVGVLVVTAVVIFPLNAKLLNRSERSEGGDRRALVVRWYRLHGVRALLSLAASASFVVALIRTG
jgi:uncharacterized membrane protein